MSFLHFFFAESLHTGSFDEELCHENSKGANVLVAWVVDDVQICELGPLEHLECVIKSFNRIVSEIKILKLGQFLKLIIEISDLVPSEMKSFERWKSTFPTIEINNEILREVELFKLGQVLEVCEILKLVVHC